MARPVRPSGWCYWHDPELAEAREEARRRGGANRSNKARIKRTIADADLDLGEVQGLLVLALKSTLAGEMHPAAATAAASVSRALVELKKIGEFEQRLAEVEKAVGQERGGKFA